MELLESPRTIDVFVRGNNVQGLTRAQCDKCHIQGQGYALGLSLKQLTRPVRYPDGELSQVDAWVEGGLARQAALRQRPSQPPQRRPSIYICRHVPIFM